MSGSIGGIGELCSVWDALFAETPLVMQDNMPLNYDPILLREAMRIEGIDTHRYSFKHLSQIIQNDKYSGLVDAGLNCLLKLRRELINTFSEVDNENEFSLSIDNAKHRLVYEAFRSRLMKLDINLDQLMENDGNSIDDNKSMNTLLQSLKVINECGQVINELKQAVVMLESLKKELSKCYEMKNQLDNYSINLLKS